MNASELQIGGMVGRDVAGADVLTETARSQEGPPTPAAKPIHTGVVLIESCAEDDAMILDEDADLDFSGSFGRQEHKKKLNLGKGAYMDEEIASNHSNRDKLSRANTDETVDRSGRTSRISVASVQLTGEISEAYKIGKQLGRGGFGIVYLATDRKTGKQYACKTIKITEHMDEDAVEEEIGSIIEFDHENIIKLRGFFMGEDSYHLVMDLCTGGDLKSFYKEYIATQRVLDAGYCTGIPCNLAAGYIWQMLAGLAFLHQHLYIHRDVKPGNFLLANTKMKSVLKLSDFGFACRMADGEKLTQKVGSPFYAAPEVLAGEYRQNADVWSLGVTCFEICAGRLPFNGKEPGEYQANVRGGYLEFIEASWKPHTRKLRTLVFEMMVRDNSARLGAQRLLADNVWLAKHDWNHKGTSCCVLA